MKKLWVREEAPGYIIAFPGGRVDLFRKECRELIEQGNVSEDDFAPFQIKQLEVGRDFKFSGPVFVWLELTHQCNLTCKHCYIEAGAPREGELTTPEVFRVIDQCVQLQVFLLILTGGEPLLRPDLPEIIQYAHGRGMAVGVITNGTLLTPEFIAALPRKKFSICISVDGINYFREMRGAYGFEEIAAKIIEIKRANIPCSINSTIARINIDEVGRIVEWCDQNQLLSSTAVFLPLGRARKYKDELELSPEDLKKVKNIYKLEMMNYFKLKSLPLIKELNKKFIDFTYKMVRITRRCKGGRYAAYVAANGEVYPCSNCASDEMYPAGNIRSASLVDLWNNSFTGIRAITWENYGNCRGCKLDRQYFCTSRCPVLAKYNTGNELECGARSIDRALYDVVLENFQEFEERTKKLKTLGGGLS